MRVCKKCVESKDESCFYKTRIWLSRTCKSCADKVRQARKRTNIQATRSYARNYYHENKEKLQTATKKWRAKNIGSFLVWNRRYCADRYANKVSATPKWANKFFMEEIYRLAAIRSSAVGVPFEVDHIVPLKSELVCGLHWEGNMRVIPMVENCIKGNRWWPDMPTL